MSEVELDIDEFIAWFKANQPLCGKTKTMEKIVKAFSADIKGYPAGHAQFMVGLNFALRVQHAGTLRRIGLHRRSAFCDDNDLRLLQ